MNNQDVAEMFADGKSKATGSNFFIEGNVIYSYGYHFPIAIRLYGDDGFKYIFNTDGYSQTTSVQKGRVLRAIGQDKIILSVNTSQIKEFIGKTDVKEIMLEQMKDKPMVA